MVRGPPDSISIKDTSEGSREFREAMKAQHIFMTETYSKRTWQRPQQLQETVIASRVAGFKKALFTSLITDVLPFHTYSDYITLNEKDFHNPLSSGMFQRFTFRLEEEIFQQKDTVWVISFIPKKDPEQLSGTLYIHSNRYAIAHITAAHIDTTLKRTMGIEQQYSLNNGRWFPQELNYNLHWKNIMGQSMELYMKGKSKIVQVVFGKDAAFGFNKSAHIQLPAGADERNDTAWKALRPLPLNAKDERTYVFMDSLGKKHHFDNFGRYLDKLTDGLFPLGPVDFSLLRLYANNPYEKNRIGLGLQTNDRISKWFTVGGWFGYGTADKSWKYGAFTEFYANRERYLTLRLSYSKDLRDPGRLIIHNELDKNFLRGLALSRADEVTSYAATIKKRMGYWETALTYTYEQITPKYSYALDTKTGPLVNTTTNEASFNIRYAYAERMAPMFGRYYSLGSKYPIVYANITAGKITNNDNGYLQAIAAFSWQKHINRWGHDKFLLIAAKSFSNTSLPLGKLFAGNGFLAEGRSVYTFGGMQTMRLYEYYSDRFINFYWNHEFDFKLYNKKISRKLSSAPTPGIVYNVLWGGLKNREAHKLVDFSVPSMGYHEGGILINRLLRMKFMGLSWLNINAGYMYHFKGPFDHTKNGRFVIGLGMDL